MSGTQHLAKAVKEVVAGLQVRGIENVSGVDAVDGVIIVAPAGSEADVMEEVEKNIIDEGVMDVNP
jgi:hypothetical protein